MEEKYPKIKIYLSFNDSVKYLVEEQDRIILKSEFKNKKKEIAYFYEISKNEKTPILNEIKINDIEAIF